MLGIISTSSSNTYVGLLERCQLTCYHPCVIYSEHFCIGCQGGIKYEYMCTNKTCKEEAYNCFLIPLKYHLDWNESDGFTISDVVGSTAETRLLSESAKCKIYKII
jgi:hypothetical protein